MHRLFYLIFECYWNKLILDSCKVNNGGCDCDAQCSHDKNTNAVKCTCNPGYTNTGSGSTVSCTGKDADIYILLERYCNLFLKYILDSCKVKNGGCDPNASCFHDTKTNAVQCRCKIGYTNTGSESKVVCTGNTYHLK